MPDDHEPPAPPAPTAGPTLEPVTFTPIGRVRSPFRSPAEAPIQASVVPETEGEIVIEAAFAEGLADVDGFSHLIVLYVFDRIPRRDEGSPALKVVPYLDDRERGVFATRAPDRPNPIGMTITRLLRRDGNVLRVAGVDMLDGTSVLDIKPYIPHLNPNGEVRIGWLTGRTEGFRAP